MNIPEELFYTKMHEWVKQSGSLLITGITDFAQHTLTHIVFVELPEPGLEVKKDQPFMVVESVKSVSDIFAVANGTVAEVNQVVQDNPGLVNQDPYGKGWLAKIKPGGPLDASGFFSAADYKKFCEESKD